MKRAVALLSGGLDSTTTLATAIAHGYEAYALSFDYGQRHQIEIDAARRIAGSLGAKEHRVAKIDMRMFGGSALTLGGSDSGRSHFSRRERDRLQRLSGLPAGIHRSV